MTANQTRQPFTVNERQTALLSFQLVDELGEDIALTDLTSLTVTLYDIASGEIINERESSDALNANDVEVSAAGLVSWTMTPDDNAILKTAIQAGSYERHMALFEWGWNGDKEGREPIEIYVTQMTKVP
jgi:hypothetical protein